MYFKISISSKYKDVLNKKKYLLLSNCDSRRNSFLLLNEGRLEEVAGWGGVGRGGGGARGRGGRNPTSLNWNAESA